MMWQYNNKELKDSDITPGAIGFIYLITNNVNGKKYIGRKLLTKASKRKPIIKKDGLISKRKTTGREESNWKNYFGSCKELTEDVKVLGRNHFDREILCFCCGVAQLNYMEAKYQFKHDVLESDDWYNSNIMIRAYKKNILNKV